MYSIDCISVSPAPGLCSRTLVCSLKSLVFIHCIDRQEENTTKCAVYREARATESREASLGDRLACHALSDRSLLLTAAACKSRVLVKRSATELLIPYDARSAAGPAFKQQAGSSPLARQCYDDDPSNREC